MKRSIRIVFVAVMVTLFLAGTAMADIMMKQKHHTDSYQIMGNKMPAKDTQETIWITKDGFRSEGTESIMIFRIDKNTAYVIDKKAKTYMEQSLNMGKMMDNAMNDKNMSAQEKKAMKDMMGSMMQFKVIIKETNAKKKINNWNCRKYEQRLETVMGPTITDIWATQDIKMDQALFNRYKALTMSLTSQAGFKESFAAAQKEMAKIKGVTVLSSTSATVMGTPIKSTIELLEYKQGDAPAGILDIPAGYSKAAGRNMPK